MSVLIKGMEMPTEGEYNLTLYVCSDGSAYVDAWSFPEESDKFLVAPILPHGRLIDADEIAEHKYVNIPIHNPEYANGEPVTESEAIAFKIGWNFALASVAEHAPTIIEEEGE